MKPPLHRRDFDKFCANKIRYANRADAHTTIRGLVKSRKQRNLHSYRCPNPKCGGWHITSQGS